MSAERGNQKRSSDSEWDGMSLPPGKTCGDCRHLDRCTWLFNCKRENEVCDFAPSRFSQRPACGMPSHHETCDCEGTGGDR